MYLARVRIHERTTYVIRQSYASDACMRSRDLFDLGADPSKYILYPGGNSYYYDPSIQEALEKKGVDADDSALDDIFFHFLRPDIRKIITDFDRDRRHGRPAPKTVGSQFVHDFDKRRFHYLRFGHSTQKHLNKVPQKRFGPLMAKSRDELEQYFQFEEDRIISRERPNYLMIIFQLHRLQPSDQDERPLSQQIDDRFLDAICRLDADDQFMAGIDRLDGLHPYLARYVIDYFDSPEAQHTNPYSTFWDFIGRHRRYTPPPKIQVKIKEVESLFGASWTELKRMSRSDLSRRYRKAAIRHHPDQGGAPETFRRLTRAYKALLRNKPRRGRQ